MKKAAIYPYKRTSEGAKCLAEHLEGRLIHDLSSLRDNEIVINWGAGYLSATWNRHWLNKPTAICAAVQKLQAFRLFERAGVPHPLWTQDSSEAQRWLSRGNVVLARQTSTGYMGSGISIVQGRAELPSAEFYSRHVKHDDEYRIHAFRGRVVNIGQKFAFGENANPLVRNWGDWKFKNPADAPECVKEAGIAAVRALGLDFGAADIGYVRESNTAHVFEVNTAPGTGHHTITRYAEAFSAYLETL